MSNPSRDLSQSTCAATASPLREQVFQEVLVGVAESGVADALMITDHYKLAGAVTTRVLAALPAQGWRPIESAAKDEDVSILVSASGSVWFQACWDDEAERFVTFNSYLERDTRLSERGAPSPWRFWIPLPAPPMAHSERQDGIVRDAKND